MTKFNKILIGALAAAGLSPSAFALTQAQVDAVVGTPFEFFISGATASDATIKTVLENTWCDGTANTIYMDLVGTTYGGNWFAVACHTIAANTATTNVPAALLGKDIIVHKRTKIGSIYGVYPVALNSYNEFLNLHSGRGTTGGAAGDACVANGNDTVNGVSTPRLGCAVAATGSAQRGLPRHAGNADECDYQTATAAANPAATGVATTPETGDTICRRISLGTSDVESEMFQGVNMPNFAGDNFVKLTTAQNNQLTRTRAFGQLFSVAVSPGVFTTLQAMQGITVGAAINDGSNWPSLSRDTIRAILHGDMPTWSAAVGATFATTATAQGFSAAIDNMAVCRREQGSGSQASSNVFFLNYPCDTTFQPAQDSNQNGNTWTSGLFVKENTSSTFVKNCLNGAEAGTADANLNNPAGAIGVLSFNGNAPTGSTWKYVKIDGQVPSQTGMIKGTFDFWLETQLAYNKVLTTSFGTSNEKAFVANMVAELTNPAKLSGAVAPGVAAMSFNQAQAWDLAPYNSAFPATTPYIATQPVVGSRHGLASTFPTSGTPLSCRPILNDVASTTGTINITR